MATERVIMSWPDRERVYWVGREVAQSVVERSPEAIRDLCELQEDQLPKVSKLSEQQQKFDRGLNTMLTGTFPDSTSGNRSGIFAVDVREPSFVARAVAFVKDKQPKYRVRTSITYNGASL